MQLDGQTDFTHALEILENNPLGFEELLANCDFDCLPEPAQPLIKAALQKMYQSPNLQIGGKTVPQAIVRERLKLLNGDILQSIYDDYLSANTVDKPIKNRIGYLISMIYNNTIEELAEQGAAADESVFGTITDINREILDPLYYLQSDNPAIRAAAEHKVEMQNSG